MSSGEQQVFYSVRTLKSLFERFDLKAEENVLEDNQYYGEFKEFAVAMKVVGWIPWKGAMVRDNAGGFRLFCPHWAKVYCAFAIALTLVGNTLLTVASFHVAEEMPEDQHLFYYLFIYTCALTNYFPLLVAIQFKGRREFLITWYRFQKQMEACALTDGLSKIRMRTTNKIYMLLLVASSCTFFVARGTEPKITEVWRALGFIFENWVVYWAVYSAYFMTRACNALVQEYKFLLELNESGKGSGALGRTILSYRSLLLQMCCNVASAGGGVSICIAASLFVNFGRCLYAGYQLLTLPDPRNAALWLPFFVYGFFPIFATCESCYRVQKTAFAMITSSLELTKLMKTGLKEKEMMQTFLIKLTNISPAISFNQYFSCDRRLLAAIIGGLITDIILLIQFNIKHQNFGSSDYVSFSNHLHNGIVRYYGKST